MSRLASVGRNGMKALARGLRYSAATTAFAFALYLPFALQRGTFALPAFHFSHAARAATLATKMGVSSVTPQHGEAPWSIDFADQPDGILPRRQWNFTTGSVVSDYNDELEAYTARAANARVQDGLLILEAQSEELDGKPYTSARIDTKGKFDFTYGTLSVTAKLPAGNGTWPAVWLLPASDRYDPASYGITPSNPYGWALNGEIDFLESIGSIPGQDIPAIHSYDEVQRAPTYTPGYVPTSASAFHTYGVIKTPTAITFTIDDVPYNTRTKTSNNPLEWPYDQPYYLIIDLAVGGKWAGAEGVDATSAPWQLQIKSIDYTPLR